MQHPRRWRDFEYVYPVVSRRSKGLSIGVNLNADKVCNFDCVYCQVDRSVAPSRRDVDLNQVGRELDWMLGWAATGAVWADEQFADVPAAMQRINDIAFSGDGEPTTYPRFTDAVRRAIDLRAAHGLSDVRIAVLTNATMFHRPAVREALDLLGAHHGEIWAKLDAGTDHYYQLIDRTSIPLRRVLDNLLTVGRSQPIVIQSLFMKLHGDPVPSDEFEAYLDELDALITGGCQIKLVQLYTTARRPAEDYVTPLDDGQLDTLAARLRERLPALPCETYYGASASCAQKNRPNAEDNEEENNG